MFSCSGKKLFCSDQTAGPDRSICVREKYLLSVAIQQSVQLTKLNPRPRRAVGATAAGRVVNRCSDVGLVFMAMNLGKLEQISLCGVSRATDTTAAALLDHPDRRLKKLRLEGACRSHAAAAAAYLYTPILLKMLLDLETRCVSSTTFPRLHIKHSRKQYLVFFLPLWMLV